MARGIRIGDIGDFCREEVELVVKKTTQTLHSKLKLYEAASNGGIGTPVDTGVLIGNWEQKMDNPLQGRVFNRTEYAEPVIMGKNLPPSWGGKYRTRQGTKPGYPESIADEVAKKDVPKIVNDIRRRRR
jgi:hypothetical protein|tara:strand:+ start:292 stop:678 length:387 start_codon:yes stop_codon:yes gene_type:complete